MYSFTVKSKVFQILTYIRQERPNEQYRNTVKDLLLPNTVSQKDEKPHTAGLDDTAIPHIKIKITEIPLEKKLNTVNPRPMSPSVRSKTLIFRTSQSVKNDFYLLHQSKMISIKTDLLKMSFICLRIETYLQ